MRGPIIIGRVGATASGETVVTPVAAPIVKRRGAAPPAPPAPPAPAPAASASVVDAAAPLVGAGIGYFVGKKYKKSPYVSAAAGAAIAGVGDAIVRNSQVAAQVPQQVMSAVGGPAGALAAIAGVAVVGAAVGHLWKKKPYAGAAFAVGVPALFVGSVGLANRAMAAAKPA